MIEGSAFVAAPSGGMTLAQLGAEVIRFDPIGGGIDHKRWPLTRQNESLYWAGLNKNKRSIAVNLRDPEAQELLTQLIVDAGTFLTNFPARGWMGWDELSARRSDLVMLAITGNRDGSTALDYTVNAAVGYPLDTGPADNPEPVNHVLPAWDLVCGQTAALGILAADRRRLLAGEGSHMTLALSDVALAAVAALGHVAEAQILREERPSLGNDLYGAFGTVFRTRDNERIYVVAISPKQWRMLLEATASADAVALIEQEKGLDFRDEGDRFAARAEVAAVMQGWIGDHDLAAVGQRFDELGVCWGAYQSFLQLVDSDPRVQPAAGLFHEVDQPRIGRILSPGAALAFGGELAVPPAPAPALGQDTEYVLSSRLGLTAAEIGGFVDRGVVDVAD